MDLLFICRDALASSLMGILLAAIAAKRSGQEVGVLFTQEALKAAADGFFRWPGELQGQEVRQQLADAGARLGLPVLGRGEGRQLDVRALVQLARREGIRLYACPTWSSLLGLEDVAGLERASEDETLGWLLGPTRVVGSL
jgi:peroxiredoxin family protein